MRDDGLLERFVATFAQLDDLILTTEPVPPDVVLFRIVSLRHYEDRRPVGVPVSWID